MALGENVNIKVSLPQLGELSIPSEKIVQNLKPLAEEWLTDLIANEETRFVNH